MKGLRKFFDGPVLGLVVLFFLASSVCGQTSDNAKSSQSLFDSVLNPAGVLENTATPIAERVLNAEPKLQEMVEPPPNTFPNSNNGLIKIPSDVTTFKMQAERMLEQLRMTILPEYLKWYCDVIKSPGCEMVKPEHLNLRLLKIRPARRDQKTGKVLSVVFDDQFHQHVRDRGRQLKLIESGRFKQTVFAGASVFAGLLLLYGILKIINAAARAREDHLSNSQISMV